MRKKRYCFLPRPCTRSPFTQNKSTTAYSSLDFVLLPLWVSSTRISWKPARTMEPQALPQSCRVRPRKHRWFFRSLKDGSSDADSLLCPPHDLSKLISLAKSCLLACSLIVSGTLLTPGPLLLLFLRLPQNPLSQLLHVLEAIFLKYLFLGKTPSRIAGIFEGQGLRVRQVRRPLPEQNLHGEGGRNKNNLVVKMSNVLMQYLKNRS